jgi:hypothetical protein
MVPSVVPKRCTGASRTLAHRGSHPAHTAEQQCPRHPNLLDRVLLALMIVELVASLAVLKKHVS